MSNYKKRRHSSGGYSHPPKKGNTGAKIVKGIAIVMAAFAGISLLVSIMSHRLPSEEKPTEPAPTVGTKVSYAWAERTYQWPIDKSVADGFLTLTQTQGSSTTSSNCTQLYLTSAEDDSVYIPEWTDFTVDMKLKVASCETRTEFSLMGRLHTNEDGSFSYYEIKFRTDTNAVYLFKTTVDSTGYKNYTMQAMMDQVFTNDEFHLLRVRFTGNTVEIFVDDFARPCLIYEDFAPFASGTVGVDLARLGIATVDYIKVCDSDNVIFMDDFTDARYFPAESSEATE